MNRTEPIRDKKQIEMMKMHLNQSIRNYLLFVFGINPGLSSRVESPGFKEKVVCVDPK